MLVDTSVALALLLSNHVAHDEVLAAVPEGPLGLAGHALAETYSVLTRMPGRLSRDRAMQLIEAGFPDSVSYSVTMQDIREMASAGIAGGQVYDGLVALAARAQGRPLLSRDRRAIPTYRALQAQVRVLL